MQVPVDLSKVMTYGDHMNDGIIQISFTLPIPFSLKAKKAAVNLALKMGIESPDVVHYEELLNGFTFFIVYGNCKHSIDFNSIELEKEETVAYSKEEIENLVLNKLKKEVIVVGASTGTDTHTIGIDSILNMKGHDGHYGLERYKGFNVYNLGGQVPNEVLLAKSIEVNADAILVSQTVTQQRLHIHNLTQLIEMAEAEGIRDKVLMICGGARITNELAQELGYDVGFTQGNYANHVGTYIVNRLLQK